MQWSYIENLAVMLTTVKYAVSGNVIKYTLQESNASHGCVCNVENSNTHAENVVTEIATYYPCKSL